MLTRSSRTRSGFGRSMGRSRRDDDASDGLAAQYSEPLVVNEDIETGRQENSSQNSSDPASTRQTSNTAESSNDNNDTSTSGVSSTLNNSTNEHSEYTVNSTLNTT